MDGRHNAVGVDDDGEGDVGRGEHGHRQRIVRIHIQGIGVSVLLHERRRVLGGIADVHAQHHERIGVVLAELLQVGHLAHAGRAPRRPQVDQHRLAAMIGELEGRAVAEGDLKVRGFLSLRDRAELRRQRRRAQKHQRQHKSEQFFHESFLLF